MKRRKVVAACLLPAILGIASLIAAMGADAGRDLLRWDRAAIANGEYWRIITAHLVHMSWQHFLLNALGLALVWMLVGNRLTTGAWLLLITVSVAGMGLGFWYLDPELEWYVGMSGLLHGLLMAGLIVGLDSAPLESLLIGAFVVAKLVFEQFVGPLPGSESVSGGAVIVNAHLYGAISATMLGALYLIRVRAARAI